MIDLLRKLFEGTDNIDYAKLIKAGAVILDVRSKREFAEGHLEGSINIPVNQLEAQMHQLDKSKTIITCCASGMRSASAKNLLDSKGFGKVYNAGSWSRLEEEIKR